MPPVGESEVFDVVILGSGLLESVLAAALSREGRSVLLVDDTPRYGGEEACVSPREALELPPFSASGSDRRGALGNPLDRRFALVRAEGDWTADPGLLLDLSPALVRGLGVAVDALAESGVSRYAEFHAVEACHFLAEGDASVVARVPLSRGDVFSSPSLDVAEKRHLMRFIQGVADGASRHAEWTNEREGLRPGRTLPRPQNKPVASVPPPSSRESFGAHLRDTVRLPPRLASVVTHAVALLGTAPHESPAATSAAEGLERVRAYLSAVGRFGPTPFICCRYGVGELCQALVRFSAVHGGLCALASPPRGVRALEEGGGLFAVDFEPGSRFGGTAGARTLVVGARFRARRDDEGDCDEGFVVRGVFALASRALPDGRAVLVVAPSPDTPHDAVHVVQLDEHSGAAGPSHFVLHATLVASRRDLVPEAVERIEAVVLATLRAVPTASMYLARAFGSPLDRTVTPVSDLAPSRWECGDFHPCALRLDVDHVFARARRMFSSLCPGRPFMPASETERRARAEAKREAVERLALGAATADEVG